LSLRVFIVEDHPQTLRQLCAMLDGVPGITVAGSAQTEHGAVEWLEAHAAGG
jgi:DNA-binding NarL/FixJ family response regulator